MPQTHKEEKPQTNTIRREIKHIQMDFCLHLMKKVDSVTEIKKNLI